MAWPKGKTKTKTGGRQKGTPNKRTQTLIERAEALGVDPFEVLLYVAKGDWKALGYKKGTVKAGQFGSYEVDLITLKDRMFAASDACQYIHPKRKAVELTGKGGGPLDVFLNMTPEQRAATRADLEKRLGIRAAKR